ncbi:Neuropeptide FF receptor 1 [Bulinus truncatus]|nr:Neuropeptide FF receptor 1 [Bulinus truncatus]
MTSHMVTITHDVTSGSTESSSGVGIGVISMNDTTERNLPLDGFPIHVTQGNNVTYYNVSFSRDVADMGHREGFYYSGDIYDLYKPWIHEPNFIPTVAVYGVTFLLGLVGNSLVIFAMLGDRKSRSVTASFMVSLAVADLLFLLVCVPYEIAKNFTAHWYNGPALCKLSGVVEMLSSLASVLNLIAVSVERVRFLLIQLRQVKFPNNTASSAKMFIYLACTFKHLHEVRHLCTFVLIVSR